jgi:hypothetical protein
MDKKERAETDLDRSVSFYVIATVGQHAKNDIDTVHAVETRTNNKIPMIPLVVSSWTTI